MTPLVVVVGPTASGKSALATQLCTRLNGELISADSVQIYRHFDIGSAKPTASEQQQLSHHLIDALDPLDTADAARFVELAEARIQDIRQRGKQPVVCGGTFLWVRALLHGLAKAPPADEAIRARHREQAERLGRAHLHAQLRDIDPQSHDRLGPNDLVRVSRALEVYELTGRPLSAVQAEHGFVKRVHEAHLIGINHQRPTLHQRIEARATQMLARGWVQEVRDLLAQGYAEARALRSVGYRQIVEALELATDGDTAALCEKVTQATRAFARHQMTWLRSQPVHWLQPESVASFAESFDPERPLSTESSRVLPTP